jgi:hypothetical protein
VDRSHRILVLVSVLVVSVAVAAQSATLTVRRDGSGDFTTIQPALDAAAPGDTIDIGPGEYTEFQTIRPPLWNWDLEIYAYVTVDDLTIVGAGADQTLIGPLTPQYDYNLFTPECLYAGNVENLLLRDLAVRNCYCGIYGSTEDLAVFDSRMESMQIGIAVLSDVVQIEDCTLTGIGSVPVGVQHTSNCAHSLVHDCTFSGCDLYYGHVEDFVAENCTFDGGNGGIGVYFGSSGVIDGCEIECHLFGIEVAAGSTCEIRQTHLTGGNRGINIEGGQTSVTASYLTIESTTETAIRLYGPGAVSIHDSDLLPASGYAVQINDINTPPSRTYDFTGNYWGVTDTTAIEALIWDAHDSAVIDDYIDFVPFAGQSVPTESATWGAVKALFR